MMKVLSELYTTYAELYSIIGNDRNFKDELRKMGILNYSPEATFIELFAGPAYHSIQLTELGYNGGIIAIDNSSSMKSVAKKNGFQGNYQCCDVIDGLSKIKRKAEVICIPRYSLVLVDEEYVEGIFNQVKNLLTQDGLFFIEIHKDSVGKEKAPICGDWESLGIYRREINTEEATIECLWPFTTEIIDIEKNILDMSVKITKTFKDNSTEELLFKSREHLHPRSTLDRIAQLSGLKVSENSSFDTNDGHYIAYELSENNDREFANKIKSTDQKQEEKLLLDKAFNRVFDISSKDSRKALLKQSGLDVDQHTSPLSLHVYNLL